MLENERMIAVHNREFGTSDDGAVSRIICKYGGLPNWLSESFRAILVGEEIETEFFFGGDVGASILLEANELLGWNYVDDGEWVQLELS